MSFTARKPVTLDDIDDTQNQMIVALGSLIEMLRLQGEMVSKVLMAVTQVPDGESKLEQVLRELVNAQGRVEERLDDLVEQLKAGRA